ncbi:unnamed protein product [Cylindrotheca closterium]|uniref:Serine/threonine specific protein phosphatases domain-containing protein n=1 Tax=Cylindrotheca closterium TaxID=2856 RepID=A0AAD2FMW9_9STRA|nr:unnamed protein product [Cylindrotheca closterium]
MKDKMMIERQNSGVLGPKRLGDFLLPLQVTLLVFSGLLVMQMSRPTTLEASEERNLLASRPRRLRQTPTVIASHIDYKRKRAVIDALQKLYEGSTLDKAYVQELLKDGKQLLSQSDTIYHISLPTIGLEEDAEASKKGITVVGDIHGDFFNMIHLFKINGFPSLGRPYIFNGDFTDRGDQSLQCLLGLLLIKRYCNECIHLHTGNHETWMFYTETLKTQVTEVYDWKTYQLVREVLLQLPLGAIVDGRIFVVHGGIPMNGFNLNDLRHYQRGLDVDDQSKEGYLFRRSVWSDPESDDDDDEKDDDDDDFFTKEQVSTRAAERIARYDFEIDEENDDDRGWYTSATTKGFLEKNGLEYVVRAHQSVSAGFRYHHDGKVLTIHSFPKKATDSGAYLNIYSNDRSMNVEQFAGVKHTSINHQSKLDWRAL